MTVLRRTDRTPVPPLRRAREGGGGENVVQCVTIVTYAYKDTTRGGLRGSASRMDIDLFRGQGHYFEHILAYVKDRLHVVN